MVLKFVQVHVQKIISLINYITSVLLQCSKSLKTNAAFKNIHSHEWKIKGTEKDNITQPIVCPDEHKPLKVCNLSRLQSN